MTNKTILPTLMQKKLRENALLSIRLGIDDFELSQRKIGDGDNFENNEDDFKYKCFACGNSDLITPLLMLALYNEDNYDWQSGEHSNIEHCYDDECNHDSFLISEQLCVWCNATLDYTKCSICGEYLKQDDQDSNGLCSYHSYVREKTEKE